MTDKAYLSVRVPKAKQQVIKAIAHHKGISVQQLMNGLIDELISAENKTSPPLGKILAILRAHEDELRSRGIARLFVFGSVARGEENTDSDVDLMADFQPAAPVSIVTLGSLTSYLKDLIGREVDFADRASFRPEVLKVVEQEAVEVFR